MSNDLDHKKIFRDICKGFSVIESSIGKFFVKHVSYEDQTDLDDLRENYYNSAKERGLPTLDEAIKNLQEENSWTQQEESKLKNEENFLNNLINGKKKLYLKSQIDSHNKQIEKTQEEIYKLKNKRSSLIGNTCENHADQSVTEDFIKKTFCKDSSLKELAFCDSEFDDLDASVIGELVILYSSTITKISDDNIQKMVLCDFFSYYMSFCEEPFHFYGKPVIELTHNQLKLVLYARYFKNILSNSEKIPEEYKKDPEKLIEFVTANENAKKYKETEDGQASSIVGATKEDYEYLNMTQNNNAKAVSIGEEAKKKGGNLSMKDLMKMMGEE